MLAYAFIPNVGGCFVVLDPSTLDVLAVVLDSKNIADVVNQVLESNR